MDNTILLMFYTRPSDLKDMYWSHSSGEYFLSRGGTETSYFLPVKKRPVTFTIWMPQHFGGYINPCVSKSRTESNTFSYKLVLVYFCPSENTCLSQWSKKPVITVPLRPQKPTKKNKKKSDSWPVKNKVLEIFWCRQNFCCVMPISISSGGFVFADLILSVSSTKDYFIHCSALTWYDSSSLG